MKISSKSNLTLPDFCLAAGLTVFGVAYTLLLLASVLGTL